MVKFLGRVIDGNGVDADVNKVTASKEMKAPKNIAELRRFHRMVN